MMYKGKTIVAIDPGSGGGIACFAKNRAIAVKMPKTVEEIKSYLGYLNETYGNIIVFIEKVQAYIADDEEGGKKFGINKMLANYTTLTTVISMLGFPYCEVYPVTWQSQLDLRFKRPKGMDDVKFKTMRKNKYKDFATNCFPEVKKMNLAIADALCIVQFGLWKYSHDQIWIEEHIKNVPSKDLFK